VRLLRLVAKVLAGIVGAVLAIWAGCLVAVLLMARRDDAARLRTPAAAIIVLGAAQYDGRPSPVLKARLDHAVDLWGRGLARRLIVTGGRGSSGSGVDWTTEAAVSRRYAVAHGVPDSAILLESEGRTSDQSLRAAAALLRELRRQHGAAIDSVPTDHADLADHATAILVSDPFHMLRLSIVARRYGIVPYMSPTPTSPISNNPRLAWRYMLGESLKVPFVYFVERSSDE
jgi:uncharacterized SAM-binding protein YcdF (DUF218 family)